MAVLERHIAVCGACREFASGQRAVWQAMDAWEAAPVSRISTAGSTGGLKRRFPGGICCCARSPVTLRRGLPAAAMTCLLLVAGILLERPDCFAGARITGVASVAQVDTVQPEQVERALDAMEVLDQFSQHVRAERPGSKL